MKCECDKKCLHTNEVTEIQTQDKRQYQYKSALLPSQTDLLNLFLCTKLKVLQVKDKASRVQNNELILILWRTLSTRKSR